MQFKVINIMRRGTWKTSAGVRRGAFPDTNGGNVMYKRQKSNYRAVTAPMGRQLVERVWPDGDSFNLPTESEVKKGGKKCRQLWYFNVPSSSFIHACLSNVAYSVCLKSKSHLPPPALLSRHLHLITWVLKLPPLQAPLANGWQLLLVASFKRFGLWKIPQKYLNPPQT